MNIDRGRLLKLLALTTSQHDGEALNAIRAVNRLLAEAKVGFPDILVFDDHVKPAPAYHTMDFGVGQGRYSAQDLNGDALRAKQAARDQQYTTTSKEHKGPFEPWDAEVQLDDSIWHDDAAEMASHITDEQQSVNFYCFAVVEPRLAQWIFRQRDATPFHHILYKQICTVGDLTDIQKVVARQTLTRERGNA